MLTGRWVHLSAHSQSELKFGIPEISLRTDCGEQNLRSFPIMDLHWILFCWKDGLDYFDTLVEEWKSAGGEEATQAMNETFGDS